ncbi:MlaD family protein [Acetobacter sp. AN02]|uniref:MlaD family protein n=1 Tax=Acetobacter sp. AN02 TaxID=2894186 RepID=UPI00243466AF|nr:MlaD family protein [Acetobacter sp. AN02]MDG6093778.1 MlaD family protein [Acetobacter sp. AN02]
MIRKRDYGAIICSSFVLACAVAFGLYARSTQITPGADHTRLSARFLSANGLNSGADVDIAGVKVGRVSTIRLDPATGFAYVAFDIDSRLKLPEDSLLTIGSATLSGENALMIQPGHSEKTVSSGAEMTNTQEPVSLEQQIGNYIFGSGGLGTN